MKSIGFEKRGVNRLARTLFLGAAISLVGLALTLTVLSEQAAAVGRAQVVENFGTTPIRGLDSDNHGNLYFTVVGANEVRMRLPDGSYRTLASFGEVSGGWGALDVQLGFGDGGQLADIFVAVDGDAGGAGPSGVYRLTPEGPELIPGTDALEFPNGLAMDIQKNLYITDTQAGKIYRVSRQGTLEEWASGPLLENPGGFAVDGIAFSKKVIYASNGGTIIKIPINPDGSSGNQSVLYQSPDLLTLFDGIAADKEGNVYATVLGTTNDFVNWESGVLRIDGQTGEATWIYDESDGADAPLSVAFGRGPHDKTTLYVSNADLAPFGNPDVVGTTIVKIDV